VTLDGRLRDVFGNEYWIGGAHAARAADATPASFVDEGDALRFLSTIVADQHGRQAVCRLYAEEGLGVLSVDVEDAAHALARRLVSGALQIVPAASFGLAELQTVTQAGRSADQSDEPDVIELIYRFEAQKGVSNRLHWPGGASGVTLGPGYDLRHRKKEEVTADLKAIGVSDDIAKKVAEGCGKHDADAKAFAKDNKNLVELSVPQEKALLAKVLPAYARVVDDRTIVKVDLNPNERAALISLVYNIGARSFRESTLLEKLNANDRAGAAEQFARWNKSGGQVLDGLTKRRQAEADLFRKEYRPAPRLP
jgi:GH24 family phage-related lysozyme (muramidase)